MRLKSARSTWISPSSHVSPSILETVASKDTGRVWSRTVRLPVTLTPPLPGLMPSTVNVMSGWLAASKKSAERRCSSRFLFLVSTDRAATVMVPVTSPAADTVPFPATSRKTPLTGASPHMLLLLSRTSDLAVSSVQDPARFPSCISACSADDVSCPDGAMRLPLLFGSGIKTILMLEPYILLSGLSRRAASREDHGRRDMRFPALRAVSTLDAAVSPRDQGDAPMAGLCRAGRARAAGPASRRSAPAASRWPGHRQRTGLPTRPDPAHRQRRARRP